MRFGGRRVLVVGDLIADEFIYGEVQPRVARGAGADSQVRRDGDRRRRRRQRGEQRRGARRPRDARGPGRARTAKDGGCSRAFRAAWTAGRSSRSKDTGRRSRRASSPAAFTRRSSRSCASIARPAGRCPTAVSRAFASKLTAGARRVRRRAPLGLRVRPRDARAGRSRSRAPCVRARGAGECRFWSTRAIGCSTTAG